MVASEKEPLFSEPEVSQLFVYFFCSTKAGEYVVSAGTAEKRMYWLQQLQRARREFSKGGAAAVRNSVNPHQVTKIGSKFRHRFSILDMTGTN